MNPHKIQNITYGSISHELGVEPGDFLLSIDGEEIIDILDYRFLVQSDFLTVEIEKPDGEIWELEIEKEPDEDLGLEFERPLMSEARVCCNKCVFCFVDQQPPGLRDTLYVKDDDARLSFLMGNYVTLTNLSKREVDRLAGYHLSPLRVSAHAADLDLRQKMMGSSRAAELFDALEAFNAAGIEMHFQAVICKGLNDGAALDYTIERLAEVRPGGVSLAVVPVGITAFRQGCYPLLPFSRDDAAKIVAQVEAWQRRFLEERGSAFVFLADEWYVLAGLELPALDMYEDFPQLDNGVGVLRLFEDEFSAEIEGAAGDEWLDNAGCDLEVADRSGRILRPDLFGCDVDAAGADGRVLESGFDAGRETDNTATCTCPRGCPPPGALGIVTGTAAEEFIGGLANKFIETNPGTEIEVFAIENNFFGENVTVSGLITGQDIISQLRGKLSGIGTIFLPQNAFRSGTEDMLDGITRQQLEENLNVSVKIGSSDGGEFYQQLKGCM